MVRFRKLVETNYKFWYWEKVIFWVSEATSQFFSDHYSQIDLYVSTLCFFEGYKWEVCLIARPRLQDRISAQFLR